MQNVVTFGWLLLMPAFSTSAQSSPKLTVVTENWLPYNYTNKDDELVGSSTEFVRRMLDNAGLEYSLSVYPWVRAYHLAQKEPNVLIYSIYRTTLRESLFHWICPINKPIAQYLYKLSARSDIQVRQLDDAKNYRLGINRESHSHQFILAAGFEEGKDFSTAPSTYHYFELLVNDRVDLLIDTEEGMKQKLAGAELPHDTTQSLMKLYEEPLCLAMSLNSDPKLIRQVEKAHRKAWESNGRVSLPDSP